jgi:mannose-6-phosphate isomerase-like protein (cupin superfamily)/rubrerythrin
VYNSYYSHAESLLIGIQREALAVSIYEQLAQVAPNEQHRDHILHSLKANQFILQQFSGFYSSLTGFQPECRADSVAFDSYQDGLRKVYELEREGCHTYQHILQQNVHPNVQHVFKQAFDKKRDRLSRLEWLFRDTSDIRDYGGKPLVININEATKQNKTYRTALWTGEYLQVTLMSIDVGDDIGLEVHPNTDQFLRIEEGEGIVQMGNSQDQLDFVVQAYDDFAIMIPAGKWHNLINTGNKPLKLYAIYAPPEHPFGTVHPTKEIAMAAESE